jgi:cytoskeletal protein CcmA (bactofilin family)
VWDQYTLLVHGVAEYEGQISRSELYLRKDSFSKYSYFTDYEPSNIYFIWSDELSGPVHSNGRFNIAGDPTFYGKVTSPQDWHGYTYMDNDPNFFGGSDFSADRRDPPTMFSLDKLKNDGGSNGLAFENEVRLEFRENKELFVTEKTGSRWSDASQYTIDLSMYNGVITSSEEISMRGTIDGQYTVHSEDDIWINGDIRYKTDPAEDSNSSDLLGIVSEKEVIIDEDAHRHEGYSNLTIHASIMALDKSFNAEDYNRGGGRGDLNLLGGIIQQQRGPMGTFSSGSIQSGFNKQYEYDERLQRMNPPSFPRESFFSIVHWQTNTAPVSAKIAQNNSEEGENGNGNGNGE